MSVTAIYMVKDEVDIIEYSVGRMLTQVDHVIVSDNGSTDGTREKLEAMPVTLLNDPEIGYYQSRKMTALARMAFKEGAEWVVPADADECWYSPHGRIADVLSDLPCLVAPADLYDHVATAEDPENWIDPMLRIRWHRRRAVPLPKTACRAGINVTIEQGNHGARFDMPPQHKIDGQLIVRHYPYRSVEQFIKKIENGAAAYAATNLPPDVGSHWRGYGQILKNDGPDAIAGVFRDWFFEPEPENKQDELILDPCPLKL